MHYILRMSSNKEHFDFPFDSSWNTIDMWEQRIYEDSPITNPSLRPKLLDNPLYTLPINANTPTPGFPDSDIGIDSSIPGPGDPGYPFGPDPAPYYPSFPGDPRYIGYPYGPGSPDYPYNPNGPGISAVGPGNYPGHPGYPFGPGGSKFPGPDGGWPGGWPHLGSPGTQGWGHPYSSGSGEDTETLCKYGKGLKGPWDNALDPKCERGYTSHYNYDQIPIPAYPQFWMQDGVKLPLPVPVHDLSSISGTPGFMY